MGEMRCYNCRRGHQATCADAGCTCLHCMWDAERGNPDPIPVAA